MVSLWGSKNGEDRTNSGTVTPQETDPSESGGAQRHGRREPSERTRLLPPRGHDGFLDPDDPAVSPYNLWSVRALRGISIIFLIISFLWWVVLLVSIFVSPPGLNSRGSGFFYFSYSTLTVGNLLVAILFYASPSKSQRISCLVIAVVLLLDLILTLAVPRLRVEEGWVGVATVAWATLMAIWTVVTDRVVAWGKKEEEERLTGRAETRRTIREWCSVLTSSIILIVLIVVAVLLTAVLIIRARDASLALPGERYWVDADKYQVHLFCEGEAKESTAEAKPTVLLEAGERPVELGLAPFAANALKNGTIDRYCYWDRPGFAWSDNAPSPLSAGMAADALSEALARAGEEGPWILVSAGIGSIYSRIFASRHATEIKGMLLIDALHEDLLYKVGAPGRGFMLWLRGILSPLGFDRIPGAIVRGRTREDRVYGRASYQSDRYIKAKLQENMMANSLTKNEVTSARTIQSRDTRLVVISSGIEVRRDSEWERKQRDLTHLTDDLVAWDIVNAAPHEVWQTLKGRKMMEKRLGTLVGTEVTEGEEALS